MTDQYEIMPPSEEAPTATLSPMWLRSLFYIHIASHALSLVTVVWLNNPVTPWINHALSAGIVLCLLKLAPASSRYRTAAILTAAVLGCTLLSKLALGTLMNLAASVLAIIAAYQELHAHGEAVEEKDPKLSRKWCALFLWQLLIGILAGFASTAATVILVLADMDEAQITQLIVTAIGLVSLIPSILYLVYLRRTIRLFEA